MARKAIFIGATGQHVGKTTVCLGLIAALKKVFPNLGFMKPVGQQHVLVDDQILVDKDVVLFKEFFNLTSEYPDMSPVILPSGATRKYLDGEFHEEDLKKKILASFHQIYSNNDFSIVEGTGHLGVGSIINLNNAQVASLLGLDIVLIVKGGLGSAFDELALNKAVCDRYGVKLRGVILNKVLPDKKEMIDTYMRKALKRWDVPLIGALPYNHLLSMPTLEDYEMLFQTSLLSGQEFHYLHFKTIRLVATSVETFKELIMPGQLIVTPATREDIVDAVIELNSPHTPHFALILTGRHKPTKSLIEKLKKARLPSLYAAKASFKAMQMITSFTAKIHSEDTSKVSQAIRLVEENLDFSQLY